MKSLSPLYRKINTITLLLNDFPQDELLEIVGDQPKKNMIYQLKQSATKLLKYIDELEKKKKKEEE